MVKKWIQVLGLFFFLFLLSLVVFILTLNPILFPMVAFLGVFFVPIAYISFLVQQEEKLSISFYSITLGFLLGGVIAILGAAILEPLLISNFNGLSFLLIGLIEELAKVAAVVVLFSRAKYAKKRQGIILGASIGMGFAIFESLGYIFVTFLQTFSINASLITVFIRGILSPLGHGTWSAILGGSLFHESSKKHWHFSPEVIISYLLASLLHAAWNYLPFFLSPQLTFGETLVGQIGLVIIGFLTLYFYWKNIFFRDDHRVKHSRFFLKR
jgi:RsiW-degrading membrane proteinase PrsW (M82 family)